MLWWQESYLDNSDHLSAHCASGDLATLAPDGTIGASAGDLAMVPSSSSRPVAAPWETLMLKEQMPEVWEALVP
jgi:hypothetical protein